MNILAGEMATILSEGGMSLVTVLVKGQGFHSVTSDPPATNASLQTGRPVRLLFKETEVMIARQSVPSLAISVRNQLHCSIRKIDRGSLLCELTLDWQPGTDHPPSTIHSIITRNACEQLNLQENETVIALVKTNE